MEYTMQTQLRGKPFKFRKWKVKDKKKYLENIKNIPVSREALIYDCIEDKNIVLDEEELKYMLVQIRNASIPEQLSYKFICEACKQEYEYDTDLMDIMTLEGTGTGEIVVGNIILEMGYPQNKDFYQQMILGASSPEAKELIDFMLHVKSFDDNDAFTFEELNDFISNMDVDVFEDILNQWRDIRIVVDNVHPVKCTHCGHEEWYEFDALPGFFPASWSIQ